MFFGNYHCAHTAIDSHSHSFITFESFNLTPQMYSATQNTDISSSRSSRRHGSSRGSYQTSSRYNYSNLNLTEEDHIKRLASFSKICLPVSIFFWCWAVLNTSKMVGKSFDLGMVSFFLSGSSSLYLYGITRRGVAGFKAPGILGRNLVLASHLIVALNYALGAFLALTLGSKIYFRYATYCIIFFFGWLYTASLGWNLVTNTLDIVGNEYEVEEEVNPSFDF